MAGTSPCPKADKETRCPSGRGLRRARLRRMRRRRHPPRPLAADLRARLAGPGRARVRARRVHAARSGSGPLRGVERRPGLHRARRSGPAGAHHGRLASRPAPRGRRRGRRGSPPDPPHDDARPRGSAWSALASPRRTGHVAERGGDPRRHPHLAERASGGLAGGTRAARGAHPESRPERRRGARVPGGPRLQHADGRDRRGRLPPQGRARAPDCTGIPWRRRTRGRRSRWPR